MPFSYEEQIQSHLSFLLAHGLEVDELQIDADYVRCRSVEQTSGRGEFAYRTRSQKMENGFLGINTWCRGLSGQATHRTYGMHPTESTPMGLKRSVLNENSLDMQTHRQDKIVDSRRVYGFFENCSLEGRSDYLDRKGVGVHGIRFRNTPEYGSTAVVPMRDIDGRLKSYQMLNADGTKVMAKGCSVVGLMHMLRSIKPGEIIGIAESYVTAATCLELANIATVCAFSCSNLDPVTRAVLERYPSNQVLILADNDRHLADNPGVSKACAIAAAFPDLVSVAVPDFGILPAGKDLTDWNDLARAMGCAQAMYQLDACINAIHFLSASRNGA